MRDEIGHVRSAMDLLQRFENKDPEKVLGGDRIEVPIVFEETKGYVNRVLEEQRDLQPYNMEYMPEHKVPKDWPSFAYRDRLNGRWTPSEVVVSASGGRGKERVKVQARQR